MRKKFPLILISAGAALFLAGFVWVYVTAARAAATPYAWAEGPVQVAGSMNPEVTVWDHGPHASIACLQCHEEVDPQQLRTAYAKGDQIDLAGWLKIDQERCADCHAPQMEHLLQDRIPSPLNGSPGAEVGQPMAVRALHDKHINGTAEASCLDCHADSAHGPVAGTPEWQEATHTNCLTCHEEQKVAITVTGSTSCGACHVEPVAVAPTDHANLAAFMGTHGESDRNCGACHLAPSAGTPDRLSNRSAFLLATPGDSCMACHQGVTMPHPEAFLAQHGQAWLNAKSGTCESCHAADQSPVQPLPQHASAQFCADCHLVPMPHPSQFLSSHGSQSLQSPQVCANCHSAKNPVSQRAPHAQEGYCTNCHNAYEHEAGWVASHGDQVDQTCSTCHATQGESVDSATHNACSSCHTSNGTWHPSMWFIKHGRVVNTEGDAACMTCHSEVEPSCGKCHRGR